MYFVVTLFDPNDDPRVKDWLSAPYISRDVGEAAARAYGRDARLLCLRFDTELREIINPWD
jgi:hypothetical protein